MATMKLAHDALPLRTVSRMTGLSPDVIRAWEKRYGVVDPRRGPRGARLYSAADVGRLRLLRQVVATGRAIGDVARLRESELARLAKAESAAADARQPGTSDDATAIHGALTALERFDSAALDRCLSEALVALGGRDFCRRIAHPLLEEVGQRWADGRLSIADEHLLSAAMRNLLGGIMRIRGTGSGPVVLLATPSGERHEFGVLLAALTIADSGLALRYLGTDLPAAEIVAGARRAQAVVVGLGIVNGENHAGAVAEVRRVAHDLGKGTELWLGGNQAPALAERVASRRTVLLQDIDAIDKELDRLRAAPGRTASPAT